jgi:hypothetical protein
MGGQISLATKEIRSIPMSCPRSVPRLTKFLSREANNSSHALLDRDPHLLLCQFLVAPIHGHTGGSAGDSQNYLRNDASLICPQGNWE